MGDPTGAGLVGGALPLLALALLLVTAYRRPRPGTEAAVAVGAVVLVGVPALLGRAPLTLDEATSAVADLAPVAAFLVAILVVGHVCERAGLFAAAGSLLRRPDRPDQDAGGAARLFTIAFLVAAAVTAVLSLDATVVLFTPVAVAAAR